MQLDELGLAAALRWHLRQPADLAGVTIDLRRKDLRPGSPGERGAVVCRIVQEAGLGLLTAHERDELRGGSIASRPRGRRACWWNCRWPRGADRAGRAAATAETVG